MKWKRAALLVCSFLTLAFVVPAGATSTTPRWDIAKVATLPSGATGLPSGFLPALGCASAGNCVAGGAYSDSGSRVQGLVLNEVRGVWKTPTTLIAPTGAAPDPGLTVNSISCGAVGNCVAVGSYDDNKNFAQSFVVDEVRGLWQRAREVQLPADAKGASQLSEVHSVSCWSAGNCSAVGSYLDGTQPVGHSEGMVVNEVRGTWTRAQEVQLPADANENPFALLNQIICTAGHCVGVGSYIGTNGTTQGLVVNGDHATWTRGLTVALPGNANAYPGADVSEVACVSAGNCTALGVYTNVTGQNEGFTVTELNGLWQGALAMDMPSDAATNPHTFFYGYGGLACPSVGNCSAGGQYLVGAAQYEGFFINEVAGVWQPATQMELPSGALMAGKNGGVVAVSCRSAGNCSAGAAYFDGSSRYQGLVVNEVANTWLVGQKIALPTGATSVGIDGGVYGLVCHRTGPCTATGSYLKTASTYEGFTVSTS
jgi:hypothetical protein